MLGDGIDQRGSLVAAEKLRFDFSHKAAVSDAELEKIEDICTSYIRQNCPVYSEDVPLTTARQICGVRAVFGETYPDPVRVVSVGIPLPEILDNLADERWRKVSIEFCGGTHVQKTGDIKELVVLEESGIAKGIRRIIAVTSEDAYAAQRAAALFAERLDALGAMALGPDKEQAVKQTQTDLNELAVSALAKARLRARFVKIHKEFLDVQKARQKAESKAALDAVTAYFAAPENAGKRHLVLRLPISSASPKAISDVLNHVKAKEKDKLVYAFAADSADAKGSPGGAEGGEKDEKKVAHGCYVGTTSSGGGGGNKAGAGAGAGIEAAEWASAVSDVLGGKAGGKGATSQGIGREVDKLDEALQVAERWITEKLKL